MSGEHTLKYLLSKQKDLQEYYSKLRPWYNKSDTEEKLFVFGYALLDEANEFIKELNWKPWKNKKEINIESLKEELIDILHFWLNLALILDMDEKEILDIYNRKNNTNKTRQIKDDEYKAI